MTDFPEDPTLDPRERQIVEKGFAALEWVRDWIDARIEKEGETPELVRFRRDARLLWGGLVDLVRDGVRREPWRMIYLPADVKALDHLIDRVRRTGGGGHHMALRRLRDFIYEETGYSRASDGERPSLPRPERAVDAGSKLPLRVSRTRAILKRGAAALEWVEEWIDLRMAEEGEDPELRGMRDEATLLRGRLTSFLDQRSKGMAGLALLTSGLDLAFLDRVLERVRTSGGGGHNMALRRLRDFLYKTHDLEPPRSSVHEDVDEGRDARYPG